LANAMDVGSPSNFERLRWTFGDDDARLRGSFIARSVDDDAIRRTIAHHAQAHGEVFCPHTATAVHLLDELRGAGDAGTWFVVATAHPAKFHDVVEPLAGRVVPPPPQLAAMLARPSLADPIQASDAALRNWLLDHIR
ncbi:MAG TPA: threonine synthase, partial [Rhodanobacteraceae bacterium]|nr:threonine synthase [Rhodanobacteraceae bacterium]